MATTEIASGTAEVPQGTLRNVDRGIVRIDPADLLLVTGSRATVEPGRAALPGREGDESDEGRED